MSGADRRPVLGCDIDNVLAEADGPLCWLLGQRYGIALHPSQVTHYHGYRMALQGVVSDPAAALREIFSDPAFVAGQPLLLPGLPALRQLRGLARALHVVTARPDTPGIRAATRRWLDAHGIPYDRLAFTRDKAGYCREFRIPYLIEDNPATAEACLDQGIAVFLVDRPYNRGLSPRGGLWRVSTLLQVPELLTSDLLAQLDQ